MAARSSSSTEPGADPELGLAADSCVVNSTVQSFAWSDVTVHVKGKKAKGKLPIIDNASGFVEAGEICALMGPSGSGKTTLLNVLAGQPGRGFKTTSNLLVNGAQVSVSELQGMSCFVENEAVLTGSLTVRETLDFSSRLACISTPHDRRRRIDDLLAALGLSGQADMLIGTPLRRSISDGQKRRVAIADHIVISPAILLLDEPTSGLDSPTSLDVISFLRTIARRNNLVVLFSIHQPSAAIFHLFDKLMLISAGKTHYFGPRNAVEEFYASAGAQIPNHINPADHLLQSLNVDFSNEKAVALRRLDQLRQSWEDSQHARLVHDSLDEFRRASINNPPRCTPDKEPDKRKPGWLCVILILCHRSFTRSCRDVTTYSLRVAIYSLLGLMLGTIWFRVEPTQASIERLSKLIMFSSTFTSFSAIAYVPAFLEDWFLFQKERRNGLYGAMEIVISNFLIGLPFLLIIDLAFSVIIYWLSNLQPTLAAFSTWILWTYITLLSAESAVVLVTSLIPNLLASIATLAITMALWISMTNYVISESTLNVFYRYLLYHWDYLGYAFQGLMMNEFRDRVYQCGEGCHCMSQPLPSPSGRCEFSGRAVLDQYGYQSLHTAQLIGYVLAIIAGFRLATWAVLKYL